MSNGVSVKTPLVAVCLLAFSALRITNGFQYVKRSRAAPVSFPTFKNRLLSKIPLSSPQQDNRRLPYNDVAVAIAEAGNGGDVSSTGSNRKLDFGAVTKYIAAIAIQMSLFGGLFTGLDAVVAANHIRIPMAFNFVLFYFLALKSRVLNPLNNQRPNIMKNKTGAAKGFRDRNMPKFTPPGVVFPIVWILIIGPLRAFTSAWVYHASGKYATPALLSLMLHLSIGDVWNTINNTERRYGTSAMVIFLVAFSNAWAAYQYYQVVPLAGKLLSLALIWFTVAGSLIWETWRINPVNGDQLDTLYPNQGADVPTQFAWFAKKE